MTAAQITDVLIVGGGPVGLTLACDLARRGIAIAVFANSDKPALTNKGISYSLHVT